MPFIGVRIGTPHASGGGGPGAATILLSALSLVENSAEGIAIGTLSVINAVGTAVFTISDTASNKVKSAGVNNVNVQAGASPVNYETTQSFQITVSVAGVLPLPAPRVFTITVTDVNEATPVITSNGGGASANISITENTTAVTTVTATDADLTASIAYSISGGADAAKFTINSTTGVIAFASAPNFDSPTDANGDNIYVVIVQASDGVNTDTQTLNVTVTDVNEFTPVITSNGGGSVASVSVAENTTAVTTVTATDADTAAVLAYSLVGGADVLKFSINSSTGVLTFAIAPDYETPTDANADNVYVVVVRVSDGTNTDDQTISVTVTDAAEGVTVDDDDWAAWVAAA